VALLIPQHLLDEIRRHGEETYPHECCGALVGAFDEHGKTVQCVVRCGNTCEDSPYNRYQISPAELLRIQREAASTGLDIVGFYHSHPDHPTRWSSTDLAEAYWTGCSYVITSVERGQAVLTSSFLLTGDEPEKRFEDEPLVVMDARERSCGTDPTVEQSKESKMETPVKLPEIEPQELKRRLDGGEDIFILDVREPHEYQICNLKGHLIPLGELPKRVHELDSGKEIVVHCKMGGRSAKAVEFLQQAGFKRATNLTGGILAWAEKVDPSMPKY